MSEGLYFSNIVTKSLEPVNSEERFFEGYLTVEVKDKQGEVTIVDELYKVLPVWMDRGAPISDTHSNRIIGKGINFARATYKTADGSEFPAIKITGKIHKNYELDNEIWDKIKNGEYKGLSFGGATKSNRTPKIMKDGSVAYALKDLEHYEVAVCKDPAVPLALITDFNPIAKSMAGHTEDRDGKMVIKCSKFGCVVEKTEELTEELKAELRGIETFEGKVQALMREGKPRENAERIVGSFTKKDSPTGHDPTQVAQSPDSPRDLSSTQGDTSSMYNQNGAEQRVNSDKAEPNVQQGVVGGEVPPQWTGSGSPYPDTDKKHTVKRKKVIKTESWKDLQKSSFELDMQWRVIDMLAKKDEKYQQGSSKYFNKPYMTTEQYDPYEHKEESDKKEPKAKPTKDTQYYSSRGAKLDVGQAGQKQMERDIARTQLPSMRKSVEEMKKAEAVVQSGQDGSSPRGMHLTTQDTEAFNVRHNGGRSTKGHKKKPEDLGNFP